MPIYYEGRLAKMRFIHMRQRFVKGGFGPPIRDLRAIFGEQSSLSRRWFSQKGMSLAGN